MGVPGLQLGNINDESPNVRKLKDKEYIFIGPPTQMDELAMGLSGMRSPSPPINAINPLYIPGGSSSGSAVAVAKGEVLVALGIQSFQLIRIEKFLLYCHRQTKNKRLYHLD